LLRTLEASFPHLRLGVRLTDLQHFEIAVDAPEFLCGCVKHLLNLGTVVLKLLEILSLETFNVEDMPASKDLQLLCRIVSLNKSQIIVTTLIIKKRCVNIQLAFSTYTASEQNTKTGLLRELLKDIIVHILD
jgi:hypothetical protein